MAHPSKSKPVLLYSGLVHGSNARGLDAIALRIASRVHVNDPFELSGVPGSQNAGALTSNSPCIATSLWPGTSFRSFAKTKINCGETGNEYYLSQGQRDDFPMHEEEF